MRTWPILLLLHCAIPWQAEAQQIDGGPSDELAAVGPADTAEAEAFFDEVMGAVMRDVHGVGATVSLVRGGEVLFANGYGRAELESGQAVSAQQTRFHIASISKLFIWTAAMQLVEEGRLDLHADVNQYLRALRVPATFDEPITMAHLMTHTAGFEDRMLGLLAREGSDLPPFAEVLAEQLPARVSPPGEKPAYSNHGTALAAVVVQDIAGQPYDQLVQRRILEPLGMKDTSLAQPPTGLLAERMVKTYAFDGEHHRELGADMVPLAPAGSITSTATDMALFMIACLQDGRLGDQRILQTETAQQMRSPLITLDPAVNPLIHGFTDFSRRGVRIIGHFGGGATVSTMLALFPDHDLGLFVAHNTGGDGPERLLAAFLDRYFGPLAIPGDPANDSSDRARAYTGEYRPNAMPHTSVLRFNGLMSTFDVSISETGELLALGSQFVETAPRVFTSRSGERKLTFIEGADGVMTHFYDAEHPNVAYVRVPTSEGRRLHLSIFLLGSFAFLGTAVAWPLGWTFRRWSRTDPNTERRIPAAARLALWSVATLLLATVLGAVIFAGDGTGLLYGELGPLPIVLALPLLALLPAAGAVFATIKMWRAKQGTVVGRISYSSTVALTVLFYWFLDTWNLLGLKF